MTAEQKFYQWFRKQLPITADCCRVETSTMGGMPDVNVCLSGRDIWVELKIYMGDMVLIRPEQNAWLHRRTAAGGQAYVIARHPNSIHIWQPPFTTIPYGKYLQITSIPDVWDDERGHDLVISLFT